MRTITVELTVPEALYALGAAEGARAKARHDVNHGQDAEGIAIASTAEALYGSVYRKLERALYPNLTPVPDEDGVAVAS